MILNYARIVPPYDRDPEFSTCYDHKAAQILANDMLSIYLNKRLHYVDKQIIIEESRAFLSEHPFRWTAPKIALVELGYSIYAACVLNNGKADIKEIMTYLEASFKVDLGDYYRTYITIKDRKKDRTSFLSNLIKCLLKKMDEDDNL
ncbi:RteC domain-containing protein [Bacteroides thetaiotaomicron]|nr:RteC domain-containing protein [Bacteroides thetaiotaomicron]